jgi:hypothetical protein
MDVRQFLRSTFKENNELGCVLLIIVVIFLMACFGFIFARLGLH